MTLAKEVEVLYQLMRIYGDISIVIPLVIQVKNIIR